MAHVRVQFRDLIKTLITEIPDYCPVFVNRADPLQENQDAPEVPCCLVLVTEDVIEIETMGMGGGRVANHNLTAQIDIVVKLGATFDDDLEAFALSAEKVMGTMAAFPGFKDVTAKGSSKGRPNGDGQSDLMMLRLTYGALAQTPENDPETLI